MNDTAFVFLVSVFVAYLAFQQWMRHQARMAIHRERLAAIDKGADLPPLAQEARRRTFNVQRILLFAGLIWISVGLGGSLVLWQLVGETFQIQATHDRFGNPIWVPVMIRDGMQYAGIALIGIGIAHLVVYALGRNRADDDERES